MDDSMHKLFDVLIKSSKMPPVFDNSNKGSDPLSKLGTKAGEKYSNMIDKIIDKVVK